MLNTFVAQCFISLIHVQSSRKLAWDAISLQINCRLIFRQEAKYILEHFAAISN